MAAEGLPVKTACRMLEVTCGGYYAWLVRPPSERSIRHAWLTDEIRQVRANSRQRYGARRIHTKLRLGSGIDVRRGQIEVRMQRASRKGLSGRRKWRRTPSFATAVDLVERQFEREQARALRTSCGPRTSPSIPRVRASTTAPSCSTPSHVGSSAGQSTPRRPPLWSPTHWAWPSTLALPKGRSSTATRAPSSPRGPSRDGRWTRGWSPRWDRSGTATTTA